MHKLIGRILAIDTETAAVALGLAGAALVGICRSQGPLP